MKKNAKKCKICEKKDIEESEQGNSLRFKKEIKCLQILDFNGKIIKRGKFNK